MKLKKQTILDPHIVRLQALQTLGSQLHQRRIELEISLPTVTEKTLIQSRLLDAIEQGHLDQLPQPIYTRALIKQYADFLGLDGQTLAQQFPLHLPSPTSHSVNLWKLIPFASLQLRPVHLYLLYIGLVVISVRSIANIVQPVPQLTQTQLTQSLTSSPPKSTLSETTLMTRNQQPVVVDVKVQEQSWVKVIVDGKVQFEGILDKGTHQVWTANEHLTMKTGNAGGVLVAVNDQQAQRLGKSGQPQQVTYHANAKL